MKPQQILCRLKERQGNTERDADQGGGGGGLFPIQQIRLGSQKWNSQRERVAERLYLLGRCRRERSRNGVSHPSDLQGPAYAMIRLIVSVAAAAVAGRIKNASVTWEIGYIRSRICSATETIYDNWPLSASTSPGSRQTGTGTGSGTGTRSRLTRLCRPKLPCHRG